MQRLDWHGYTLLGQGIKPFTEAEVYACTGGKNGKILLVENESELELAQALQLIYGSECNILVAEETSRSYVMSARDWFSRVYCTWDPLDPQR